MLGIDVHTVKKGMATMVYKLNKIGAAYNAGAYVNFPEYTQVHIDTELSIEELEQWLDKKNLSYVAVFQL